MARVGYALRELVDGRPTRMNQIPRGSLPTDPTRAKQVALFVSFAMIAGVVGLGVLLTALVPRDGSAVKPDALSGLPIEADMLSLVLVGALCLVSIASARRMHDAAGTLQEQVRHVLSAHLVATATAEASVVLAFVFVLITGSWEHFLGFLLGAALLALGVVRAVYVFKRLEAKARAAA